jgi:hypothetical protein
MAYEVRGVILDRPAVKRRVLAQFLTRIKGFHPSCHKIISSVDDMFGHHCCLEFLARGADSWFRWFWKKTIGVSVTPVRRIASKRGLIRHRVKPGYAMFGRNSGRFVVIESMVWKCVVRNRTAWGSRACHVMFWRSNENH